MALKENYKDDILDVSVNTKRKYRMTENPDGTISLEDETVYTQEGDNFGSGAINPIAHAINGLNNYTFNPSGSIELVAYIADDSFYLNEDNKYVLADSPTGQALITSEPSTYKALASNTDLYGIEGEDTVSGFEPSSTPIEVGGETLSTIDDKLNYLLENKIAINDLLKLVENTVGSYQTTTSTYTPDFNGKILAIVGGTTRYNVTSNLTVNGTTINPLITTDWIAGNPTYVRTRLSIYAFDVNVGDIVSASANISSTSDALYFNGIICMYKLQ